MNRCKITTLIEILITKIRSTVDSLEKKINNVFWLLTINFIALILLTLLMMTIDILFNMKKYEVFMIYIIFLIYFLLMPLINQKINKRIGGYYYTQLYILSFGFLLLGGVIEFCDIKIPLLNDKIIKKIYATSSSAIVSALMLSEIIKNFKEEKRKKEIKTKGSQE